VGLHFREWKKAAFLKGRYVELGCEGS
jgi:hypothetical protein